MRTPTPAVSDLSDNPQAVQQASKLLSCSMTLAPSPNSHCHMLMSTALPSLEQPAASMATSPGVSSGVAVALEEGKEDVEMVMTAGQLIAG